jgi:class 3 adenylate cyclase
MSGQPDWDAIAQAGLLDVEADALAGRRALIEFLVAQGCTVDEMTRAHGRGRLFALGGDRIMIPGANQYTLAEVAEQIGVDEGLVRRLWRAFGLAGWDSDEPVASAADVAAAAPMSAAATLTDEDRIVELARALGSGLSRIGEAMNALGRSLSTEGSLETSGSELETAVYWTARAPFVAAVGQILDTFFRHHFASARDHFERSGSYDLMLRRMARLGIGFVDVSGFTSMSEQLGEKEFANLIGSFCGDVSDTVQDLGGRVVKFVGDAAMIVAPTAIELADIAIELVRGETITGRGLTLHAGLAHGELLSLEGDYFGSAVNVASRLAGLADPGTIVATEAVGHALTAAGWHVDWVEPRDIRGRAEPMVTCIVRGRAAG